MPTPAQVIRDAIDPALALLPSRMDTPSARVMLVAIGLQESQLKYRRQHGNGPARGLWQFEKGGGVKGVLLHNATWMHAKTLCEARMVQSAPAPIWNAFEHDDVLAAGFARLLLWSDYASLPHDASGGWDLYLRTWRPGKPRPSEWSENFEMAKVTVMG